MDRFGAILVAAGRGERFGRPKAEVELAGRTLLDRALDAFAHVRPLVAVLRAGKPYTSGPAESTASPLTCPTASPSVSMRVRSRRIASCTFVSTRFTRLICSRTARSTCAASTRVAPSCRAQYAASTITSFTNVKWVESFPWSPARRTPNSTTCATAPAANGGSDSLSTIFDTNPAYWRVEASLRDITASNSAFTLNTFRKSSSSW